MYFVKVFEAEQEYTSFNKPSCYEKKNIQLHKNRRKMEPFISSKFFPFFEKEKCLDNFQDTHNLAPYDILSRMVYKTSRKTLLRVHPTIQKFRLINFYFLIL